MELKGRLKLLADKTPVCNSICDIGTDHAYLPIYLISKNICKKAIAADVKIGPIQAAKKNIETYNMNEFIDTRLGDGLEPIGENETEVIIIAGMGGILIKEILGRKINTAMKSKALILQPMNAFEILREWLYENGFEIYDEELTNEGEKLYNVMSVRWTGKNQVIDRFYYYIGLKLIEKKDPLLLKHVERWNNQLKKAVLEMEDSDEKVDGIRKNYLWLIENMKKVIKYLEENENKENGNEYKGL